MYLKCLTEDEFSRELLPVLHHAPQAPHAWLLTALKVIQLMGQFRSSTGLHHCRPFSQPGQAVPFVGSLLPYTEAVRCSELQDTTRRYNPQGTLPQ